MHYTYIELDGYKRFALNTFSKFQMTITEMLQLIIGTNGSGKSSLMAALTPLPPDHRDFLKHGSKVLKVQHHGKNYTLTSTFDPKPSHSLVLDESGEELNPGGTAAVQKDLVKELFKFDPEVDDIVQGREAFTSMSSSRRKELFIRFCPTSYDYAIRVYNKLREMHRDATGAIKLQKKKLVEESEKLVQDEEEERLTNEAKALHECLSHLLEIRKPIEEDLDTLHIQDRDLSETLMRASQALNTLLSRVGSEFIGIDEIDLRIDEASALRTSCKALLEHHNREFLSNERKIKVLQAAEQQSIEKLTEDIQALTQEREKLLFNAIIKEPVGKGAYDALQTVKAPLIEVFTNLPPNPDRRFSQQNLQLQREELNRLQLVKANTIEQIQTRSAKRKHMEAHKDKPDLTCPSCHHQFSLNYNETEYERLVASIQELERKIAEEINPKITSVQEFMDQCVEYGRLFRTYSQTVLSWPVLKPYFDLITELSLVLENPARVVEYLNVFETDILHQLHIEEMSASIAEKQALVASLRDVGGADLKTLQEANHALESLILEETLKLGQANNTLAVLQTSRERLVTIASLQHEVVRLMQSKKGVHDLQVETMRRMHFNQAVRQVQSELAKVEHVLNNLSRQKAVVEAVAQQIRDLQKDEEALAILVKQMSPTEGLIAEGLLGFINNFVDEMNQFIKKIWSYPLVIHTCEVVEGATVDLDYKFPMSVQIASNKVKDIAGGSDGMKEIINLAYRIVAMKYLGIQDSPLMMDEFGRTFDEAHRGQATYVIKSLVEQHTFPQLFMVSHYESIYGALANAQVCVLNTMNITAPKLKGAEINSHVVMS